MSMKEIERFNNDLATNESLVEKMKAAGSDVGAQIAVANANGYQFSKADIDSVSAGEISDQALENVAGGISFIGSGDKYVTKSSSGNFINW